MKRFKIRNEYFGGLVHDRLNDYLYVYDDASMDVFRQTVNNPGVLNENVKKNLIENGFIDCNGNVDFELVDNAINEDFLSSPITLHYVYTHKCNLNCKHCYSKRAAFNNELSLEQKLGILDQAKDMGVFKILIGGGEPFVCDDFIKFLSASVDRGLYTRAFTNGLLLNDKIIGELSNIAIGGISVSIDSTDEDIYEEIRGVRGLKTVISNVKKLSESCDCSVSVSATVNAINLQLEEELLDLAAECKVKRLKIRPTKPSGNALKNKNLIISPEQYRDFLKRIQTAYFRKGYRNNFELDKNWGNVTLAATESMIDVRENPLLYNGHSCIAGKGIMAIDPSGTVSNCGFLTSHFGLGTDNILNSCLSDIWKKSESFISLREIEPNLECLSCKYYASCRGGCPARSVYSGLKFNDVDPWCPKKHFPILLME